MKYNPNGIAGNIDFFGMFNNVHANWTDDQGTNYSPVTDIHPIQLFINPYAVIVKSGPTEAMAGSTTTSQTPPQVLTEAIIALTASAIIAIILLRRVKTRAL